MTILNRYVGAGFLLIFAVTVAVFTFVMGLATMIRMIDFISRGVPAGALGWYFLLSIPFILQYAIPMSVMTASLLLVTRLSLDGEINAMRACGLSLWQIVSPIVVSGAVIAVVSFGISGWAAPLSRVEQRDLLLRFSGTDPLLLLEPGQWIRSFPGSMVYVSGKKGTNLTDIVIYQHDERRMLSSIRAHAGDVAVVSNGVELLINLYGVRIEEPDRKDPDNLSKRRIIVADTWPYRVDISKSRRKLAEQRKRLGEMTLVELLDGIDRRETIAAGLPWGDFVLERMKRLVEVNGRLAMSSSCFALTLVAIPLGLRSRRRESSTGVLVSLLVIFVFYFFVMVAKSMTDRFELRPDLIAWIPVVLAQIGGFWTLRRQG